MVASVALIAGIALTVTDWFWLDPALFRACVTSAAFLAGAALGRARPFARRARTASRWIAAAAAVVAVTDVVLFRITADRDAVPAPVKLAALLGLAFLLGFGLRNRVADACAAGLAATTLVPFAVVGLTGRPFETDPDELPLYAGWLALLAVLLIARRGRWLPALPFAIALVLWHESVHWDFWSIVNLTTQDQAGFAEIFLLAAASVFLPVIAGRAAAALARDECRDGAARLVVRVQRDPWRTSLVGALIATAFLQSIGSMSTANLIVLAAGAACLAHCAAGRSFGALAPWTAAAAVSVPLSVAFQQRLNARFFTLTVLPEALIVLYVPLVVGAVVAGTRALRWPSSVLAAVLICETAAFVSMQSIIWPGDWSDGTHLIWALSWCAVVSLLVHAVATSDVSTQVVLAASPIVSLLVSEAFYGTREACSGWIPHAAVVPSLLAGPAAALLGLAARRVRSMTAVPADHPSFELAALRQRASNP